MEALLIKKDCCSGSRQFNPGDVYICGPETKKKFQALNGSAVFFHLESDIPRFIDGSGFKELLLVRGGGLGDLIALSSVITYLHEKNVRTRVLTQSRFFHVFDWFDVDVKLMALDQVLFRNYNMQYRLNLKKNLGMMQGERLIEQGSGRNWYEIFFEAIKADIDNGWFRPQLTNLRVYDLPVNVDKESILICHKATANMRSARFEDIHKALRRVTDRPLYVHQLNLTESDEKYIWFAKDERLGIIPPGSMQQFLCDVYDAGQVVSVDTVPVHFREGINKPVIGLYTSFTTEARTKYYRYAKTYDLESQCPDQPCFLHQKSRDHVCKYGKGFNNAPCMDGRANLKLHEQLISIFNESI